MRRNIPVTVWLNEAEWNHLKAAADAAGIGLSSAVRACVLYCLRHCLEGGLIPMLAEETMRDQLRRLKEELQERGEER